MVHSCILVGLLTSEPISRRTTMGRHVHFIFVGLAFATLLSTGLVSAEPKDIESDTESDRGDESDRDFAATESDGEWYRYAKLDFMDLVSYDFYEGGSEGDSENDNENDYDEEIAGNSTTQCPCAGTVLPRPV